MPPGVDPPSEYGLWTVVGDSYRKSNRTYLPVRCRCGVQRDVDRANLVRGYSRCCGAPACRALLPEVVHRKPREETPEAGAASYKLRRRGRPVRCVELGLSFESASAAAVSLTGKTKAAQAIYMAARRGGRAIGLKWSF